MGCKPIVSWSDAHHRGRNGGLKRETDHDQDQNFIQASDGTYTGTLRTLTVNPKLKFTTATEAKDKAPNFHVFSPSETEIGAAWRKTSQGGRDYLSVKLDDPSFPAPYSPI